MAEVLIPTPDLDVRSAEQIAALAIAFTSGGHTVQTVDFQIETLRELRALLEAGEPAPPVCPELTNANAGALHTVHLEAQALLVAGLARRINRLPDKVRVEFARLFRITLREATAATAALEFTVAPPPGLGVNIPAGTTVRTGDGAYTFQTVEDLDLAPGVLVGEVEARRDVVGATYLAAGTLTNLYDPVAFVTAVTNPDVVESGTDAETVESALARARNYQVRGEHLVTAEDYESAILDDVLLGSGIVKAFPLVKDGDYATPLAGYMTIVVMTKSGAAVGDAAKQRIASVLNEQMVGNIFVSVEDPSFVEFSIEADVRLEGLTPQSAILAGVEQKLRASYAATHGNFGKSIYQSDIIGIIEGSAGVQRIERQPGGALLVQPAADIEVAPYMMPKLLAVTLTPV